jgi:small conductance mechanosensitive channel
MIFLKIKGDLFMENVIRTLTEFGTTSGLRIVLAIIAWFVGRMIIKAIIRAIKKTPGFKKLEQTVALFVTNIIKAVLTVILVISIISILGVPMASVIAVLASAGVAVGMALQGALSNVAGGIMLMILRPFNVGDYVEAAGVEGVVSAINLFYTVITTAQNSKITVPNGTLMGANVVNQTANPTRRLDLTFSVGSDSYFSFFVDREGDLLGSGGIRCILI